MIDKVGETRHYGGMEEICEDAIVDRPTIEEVTLQLEASARITRQLDQNMTLEQILAAQPLNPLRPLEFRVLPLYEQKPS